MRPKFPTWLPALTLFVGGCVAMNAANLGVFADGAGGSARVRTCLAGSPVTLNVTGPVACDQSHILEVAGSTDAGRWFTALPSADDPAWTEKVYPACEAVARQAFGGRIPAGVSVSVPPLAPESWQTGQRQIECRVVRFDDHIQAIPLTAPLLP
jgi:hypothetical protein